MDLANTSAADPRSRPGLTSLVRAGRGLMTVQTELVGVPAQLVTIVDFRGRVLKSWTSDFGVDEADPDAPQIIRRWHGEIEARVRASLAEAARRRPEAAAPGGVEVVAHLFLSAMRAYSERDFATAHDLLQTCAVLLPDDARIAAALARIKTKRTHR